jgi:hypothetical protein
MLVTEFAVDELEALLRVLGRHKKFLRRGNLVLLQLYL